MIVFDIRFIVFEVLLSTKIEVVSVALLGFSLFVGRGIPIL